MKHRTLLGFVLASALCLLGGASFAAVQIKAPTEKLFKYNGATGNLSFSVHVEGAPKGATVTVTATASDPSWVQILKGATQDVILDAKGNGKGKVQYRVAAWNHYPPTDQRTGTIEVDDGAAPATFTVKQSGTACKLAIAPTKSSFLSDATLATGGGSLAMITVTAAEGCQWTATVDAASAWISTPTLGAGTVSFTVAANDTSRKPRAGKVTVATTNVPKPIVKVHTVSQKGDTTPPIVTADPEGGTFGASTEVRLSANEAGAKIYYTLNGSKASASSTLYTGPIQIARTSTLNFIGVDRAGNVSAVAAEKYTVTGGGGTFAQALQKFEAGDLGAARGILLSLDTLDDKGRALLGVATLFTVVDDAKAAGTPFKNLLDELGLQVVGDTLDTLDVIKPDQPLAARSARQAGRTVGRAVHDAPVVPDTHPSAEALLAKVKEAQTLLADVGKSVTFTVKGYEVDYSDVLAAQAALSTLEFLLEFSLAYDFTYTRYHDPGPELTAENLQDLRLASDSVTHLAASKKALVAAIDLVVLSVDAVRAETDDQSDDLLTVDGEVAAMWPDLKNGLLDAKASLGSSSFKAIRIFETGDRTLTKTQTVDGEVVATYTVTVYRAFLVAKLSALFDAPLDGADVKADFDAGRAKVTVTAFTDDFGDTTYDETFWFDPATSSVASFLKSVLQDVAFGVSEENGGQRTEFRTFFRTAATGGVLLKDAQGNSLSPSEAAAAGLPVQTSELTFTAAVALPLPTVQATPLLDGNAADWGTAAVPLGSDATIQAARDGSYLYLLVRDSRVAAPGQLGVNLGFGVIVPGEDRNWPDWFGSLYVEGLGGALGPLTGSFWPSSGTSTAVIAASGAGVVEIRLPASVFGGLPSGATVYLGYYDAWGDGWGNWWSSDEMAPLGHGLGAEDFWGYQLSY